MSQSATKGPRTASLIKSLELVKEARALAHFGMKDDALECLAQAENLYKETAWADTPEQQEKTNSLFARSRSAIEAYEMGSSK